MAPQRPSWRRRSSSAWLMVSRRCVEEMASIASNRHHPHHRSHPSPLPLTPHPHALNLTLNLTQVSEEIASKGGVVPLVALLSAGSPGAQQQAATVLLHATSRTPPLPSPSPITHHALTSHLPPSLLSSASHRTPLLLPLLTIHPHRSLLTTQTPLSHHHHPGLPCLLNLRSSPCAPYTLRPSATGAR